ncbi:MAG: DUF4177 domain-containing protein [Anaerolineales bacterium]|jgi:hypothetical protein
MTKAIQWEYRVEMFGSALRSPKEEELESVLNEWGEEGWEAISVFQASGSNKIRVVAKRPLSSTERRRRSRPGWEW